MKAKSVWQPLPSRLRTISLIGGAKLSAGEGSNVKLKKVRRLFPVIRRLKDPREHATRAVGIPFRANRIALIERSKYEEDYYLNFGSDNICFVLPSCRTDLLRLFSGESNRAYPPCLRYSFRSVG